MLEMSAMEGSDPICGWSGWPAGHCQTCQPRRVVTLSVVAVGWPVGPCQTSTKRVVYQSASLD